MKQSFIKNGLTFKILGNGKKNNIINKNIANELNDCTISNIAKYYKRKKLKNYHNSQKYSNNTNTNNNRQLDLGPKATFLTKDNKYIIIIHLIGITKNNIKLDLVGNYFIISCQKIKNILNGNKNNKFCYFKKTFKLPNDSVPESMQAKLFEERLEVIISRENENIEKKDIRSAPSLLTEVPPETEENEKNSIYEIYDTSEIDQPNLNNKKKTSLNIENIKNDDDRKSNKEEQDLLDPEKGIKIERTPSVFNKQIPSKTLKKFASDTYIYYKNNKKKILSINSSSFSNKKNESSKSDNLKSSSSVPQALRKQSKSDYELINERKESIEDVHDSGWILVTRKKHYNFIRKKPQNLIITSTNNSHTNLTASDNELHYNDPNNIYSHLYISNESNALSSCSSVNTLSSRESSRSINKSQTLQKSNSKILKSSNKDKMNSKTNHKENINKKDSKSNINNQKNLSSISSQKSLSKNVSKSSVSSQKILSKNVSKSSVSSQKSLSKNVSKSSISSQKILSKNVSKSSVSSQKSLSKNVSKSSISSQKILSKNVSKSSISSQKSLSKNVSKSSISSQKSLSKNVSKSSISSQKSLSKNVSKSNTSSQKSLSRNVSKSSTSSQNNLFNNNKYISNSNIRKKNSIAKTDPKIRKSSNIVTKLNKPYNKIDISINKTNNTEKTKKSLHQMVFERLSCPRSYSQTYKQGNRGDPSHNIPKSNKKRESIKKPDTSSSYDNGLRKNMYPTSMMRSNGFNKNNSKSSIYSDIPTTNAKNGIKPSWNHSSNTYDLIKAKILSDLNEVYRKPQPSIKGSSYKMNKPISNIQAKVDSNKRLSLSKKPSLNSSSSNIRKNSLIPSSPSTTDRKSAVRKPLLKIVTNNGNSSFKKSKIPYSPQSKKILEKIDDLITNSLNN